MKPGPNVPDWFRRDLWRMPYHQFIELTLFLERPDHVEQIDAAFSESLEGIEPLMEECTDFFQIMEISRPQPPPEPQQET